MEQNAVLTTAAILLAARSPLIVHPLHAWPGWMLSLGGCHEHSEMFCPLETFETSVPPLQQQPYLSTAAKLVLLWLKNSKHLRFWAAIPISWFFNIHMLFGWGKFSLLDSPRFVWNTHTQFFGFLSRKIFLFPSASQNYYWNMCFRFWMFCNHFYWTSLGLIGKFAS